MSNRKTIELLEEIQSVYLKYPPRFREKYLEEHIQEADEYAQSIHSIFPSAKKYIDKIHELNIPSKYQDTFAYLDIYEIFENINNVKELFNEEPFKTKFVNWDKEIPVFGTIPLNRFTALVTSANNDTAEIIIISDGLQNFAFGLCSIIAAFYPVYPNKPLTLQNLILDENYIKDVVDILSLKEHFYCLILYYHFSKNCHGLNIMSDYTIPMTEVLVEGFLHFVVAHEYCHFLIGHTSRANKPQAFDGNSIYSKKEIEAEYEADLFGAMFTEAILTKNGTIYPLSTFGINICLRAFEIIERLNDLKNIKDDSHPDYISRRNKMDEFTIRSEIDFFAPVDYIFDYLLQDFDIVVNRVTSKYNSNDIDGKRLRECIKECLK